MKSCRLALAIFFVSLSALAEIDSHGNIFLSDDGPLNEKSVIIISKLITGYNDGSIESQGLEENVFKVAKCVNDLDTSIVFSPKRITLCKSIAEYMNQCQLPKSKLKKAIKDYQLMIDVSSKECASAKRKNRCMHHLPSEGRFVNNRRIEYCEKLARKNFPEWCDNHQVIKEKAINHCIKTNLNNSCQRKEFKNSYMTFSSHLSYLDVKYHNHILVPKETKVISYEGYGSGLTKAFFPYSREDIEVTIKGHDQFFYVDPNINCDGGFFGGCKLIAGIIQKCK